MSKPNTDDTEDKNLEDDPKQVSGTPPNLDQVHQINQAKVEEEDANNGDTDKDQSEENVEENDKDVTDTADKSGTDGASDDGAGSGATDDTEEPPAPETAKSAPELDLDTTKPGEGKVPIKDVDGVTHYFNNLAEVPDDFEPTSYKALMVGTEALLEKKQADKQAAADAEVAAQKIETKKQSDLLQKNWEADAAELTTAGFLPKGDRNEAAKNQVYDYIEAEMKQGNVITSFKQAYKSMMYDKQQAKVADDKKKADDAKKQRGGMVQAGSGGGAPAPSATRGKVIEAPPAGAGLDLVHANAIRNL